MSRVRSYANITVATNRDAAERKAFPALRRSRRSARVLGDSPDVLLTLGLDGSDARAFTHALVDLNAAIMELNTADAIFGKLTSIVERQQQTVSGFAVLGLSCMQRGLMQKECDALTGAFNSLLNSAEGDFLRRVYAEVLLETEEPPSRPENTGGDENVPAYEGCFAMPYFDVTEPISLQPAREKIDLICGELRRARRVLQDQHERLRLAVGELSLLHAEHRREVRIVDAEAASYSAALLTEGLQRRGLHAVAVQANQEYTFAAALLQ